jgi:hypothetical protein
MRIESAVSEGSVYERRLSLAPMTALLTDSVVVS